MEFNFTSIYRLSCSLRSSEEATLEKFPLKGIVILAL